MTAVATKGVSVDAKDLVRAIAAVAPSASLRTPNMILRSLRLTAKDGFMRIEATDGEAFASRTVQADGECDVCLHSKTLLASAEAIQGNGAELAVDESFGAVLSSGRQKFKLKGIDPQDFPIFPAWSGEPSSFDRIALVQMFDGPLRSVSTDTHRPVLKGIMVGNDAEGMYAVSTDAHRLHYSRGPAGSLSGLIPAPFVKGVGQMPSETLDIVLNERGQWMARCKDAEYVHQSYAGIFPDWERVVPVDPPLRGSLPREDLIDALGRVCGPIDATANRVRVRLEGTGATLSARSEERGEATDFVAGGVRGEPLEFCVNYRNLIDALEMIEGETVGFHMEASSRPMRVQGEGPEYAVLMPLALA